MSDFIAPADRGLLAEHGLDSFDALWAIALEAVDEPNTTAKGGWSSVFRLELGERAFYLKRQTVSWSTPRTSAYWPSAAMPACATPPGSMASAANWPLPRAPCTTITSPITI